MTDERAADLLAGISRDSKILELGPSFNPLAPRAAGWDVTIVDHATREELIEKYRDARNVNVENIETVDAVWTAGPLHQVVPPELLGTFDVLIASHVIEHLPDPIGFMESAARLLHPERGILLLAVPDKRWCFDGLKQVSSTGQFLVAHRMKAQRHSPAALFDHVAYSSMVGGRSGWGREPASDVSLVHTLDQAYDHFQSWTDDPAAPYVDCHGWHFTPASFALLVLEAGALGLLDWRVDRLEPRPVVEFFARLKRGREAFATPAELGNRRLELLKQILLDLREQTDWLVEQAPPVPPQAATIPVEMPEPVDTGNNDGPGKDALDAEIRQDIREIAETAVMVRAALRPVRSAWRGMLPLRRIVARARGRV